jgi:hypothetical protein
VYNVTKLHSVLSRHVFSVTPAWGNVRDFPGLTAGVRFQSAKSDLQSDDRIRLSIDFHRAMEPLSLADP